MADWRQIQARIRKAKNSPDAPAKLSELYQRTRDAMVALELGSVEERSGRNEEAAKWYTIAVERFRRADWKKKAEVALARVGGEVPLTSLTTRDSEGTGDAADAAETPETDGARHFATAELREHGFERRVEHASEHGLGHRSEGRSESRAPESPPVTDVQASAGDVPPSGEALRPKRRRGRRGGRGRNRRGATRTNLSSHVYTNSSPQRQPSSVAQNAPEAQGADTLHVKPAESRPHTPPEPAQASQPEGPISALPSERAGPRRSEPALASRMAHLESMLRRLLSSPFHRLDALDEAPAGPGVFLLSDSDEVTSYYIEACQTLRVGLGNLIRGGRASKGGRTGNRGYPESNLKPKLAEHLEINESKVSQYMKDNCVVRWIQLDDEAPHLAHFAIGVLRTPLNVE